MAIRYDRAPIKAKLTSEGFIQDSPVLSRVGVFDYRQPDGSVRKEYRPAEEVFHADHLASIAGKPITDEHHGRITRDNARGKLIGSTLSPGRQDGDNVVGDIVIHDSAAADQKRELSLGYTLDLEETPGEWNGIRYDAIQRNLRVNHVALVKRGRAGNARLNLDAADAVLFTSEEDDRMPTVKVRLDSAPGVEYEASPEVAIALATAQAEAKTQKDRADGLQATADGLKAKVDGHEAALKQAREDGAKAGAAGAAVRSKVEALGVKLDATDDDKAIRAKLIKHVRGDSVDLAGKSDAYIEVAFDMALADGEAAAKKAGANRAAMTPNGQPARQDSNNQGGKSAAEARAAMIAGYTPKTKAEA